MHIGNPMAAVRRLNSDAYLKKARQEIVEWESGKRGYLARFSDFALNPAARLTARVVPASVEKTACQVIEKTLRLTAHAGKFSVDVKSITAQRRKKLGRKRALGLQLKAYDDVAQRLWTAHCGYAAAEGAATGLIGFAGLVADIPLTLSIAIRLIRSIALCYGYSTDHPPETDYVLHVLRIASTNEDDIRLETLGLLKNWRRSLTEEALQKTSGKARKKKKLAKGLQYFSLREYAKSLAHRIGQTARPSTSPRCRRGNSSRIQCRLRARCRPNGLHVLPPSFHRGEPTCRLVRAAKVAIASLRSEPYKNRGMKKGGSNSKSGRSKILEFSPARFSPYRDPGGACIALCSDVEKRHGSLLCLGPSHDSPRRLDEPRDGEFG